MKKYIVYNTEDQEELKKLIENSSKTFKDQKYIEVYISRLVLSESEPENFNLENTVKMLPQRVALFVHKNRAYSQMFTFREFSKKDSSKLLSSVKKIVRLYKPDYFIFLNESDCIDSYKEEFLKAQEIIYNKIKNLEDLQEQLSFGMYL